MTKRRVPIVILSDIHLGTPASRAVAVWSYLRSVQPEILVLNGDICDLGSYWRNHWPHAHLMALRRILKIAAKGIPVHYVVGNHDAPVRRYHGFSLGNFHIAGRLELAYGEGKRALVVHGDCFDGAVKCPRWLHYLGGQSYDMMMRINNVINRCRRIFGLKPMSLATIIKSNMSMARTYIERFRQSAVKVATDGGFDAVITGHIHQPHNEVIDGIHYLNSGDWVEHCTALEFDGQEWQIVHHPHEIVDEDDHDEDLEDDTVSAEVISRLVAAA